MYSRCSQFGAFKTQGVLVLQGIQIYFYFFDWLIAKWEDKNLKIKYYENPVLHEKLASAPNC